MSERLVSATIAELFLQAGERWGSRAAFATRTPGSCFQAVSYASWCERACALGTALIDLGVAAREHIGLLSDNRFEWILADAAIQFCGAADVPRASDITPMEMVYILNHADVQVVFLENRMLLHKLESIREQLPFLKKVILMETSEEALPEGVLSLQELERHGAALRKAGDRRVEQRVKKILPEDLFTIIYTSGTTGTPKGVQLTHRSICSQIEHITFSLSQEERALSILPVWHSYERVFEMLVISHGATLYYTSLRHLTADLMMVKPTVMASAPRLWEALYERMIAHIAKQGWFTKFLFHTACWTAAGVRQAVRFFRGEQLDLSGRSWKESLSLAWRHLIRGGISFVPFLLLDFLVLRRLRKVVGGFFKATISGGGALPPYIDAFFNDIGIRIFEGYGLTESAPVLAVRHKNHFVLGTVGPPLPETEIKIIDLVTGKILYPDDTRSDLGRGRAGEICARGPQIMKGYYKDPEGTARVLREGWLHTGDIGMMTFNRPIPKLYFCCELLRRFSARVLMYFFVHCGSARFSSFHFTSISEFEKRSNNCLKIVGRCKETIVLRSGENVEPLPIESRLLESPLIAQCIVLGQDQKQLGALLFPSLSAFVERGFAVTSLDELFQKKETHSLLQAEMRRLVSEANGFKSFERIGCWKLLPKAFEVGEELTPTYKLKRHVIMERYQDLIKKMYE